MFSFQASSFQELVRRWEIDHPYNFFCSCDVRATVSPEQLQAAASATLTEMQLGAIQFGPRKSIALEAVGEIEARIVADVDTEVEAELNRPFDASAPVRFALQRRPMGTNNSISTVGITFRHLLFDGYSGSIFARRVLLRATGARLGPLEISGHGRGRDWLRRQHAYLSPRFYARAVRDLYRMRRVVSRKIQDYAAVRVRFLRHDPELLTRVRRHADAPGVTVNDALAARFAGALLSVHHHELTRRHDTIALSVAVSLRQGIAPLTGGICVAAFPVFVRSASTLVPTIHQQTDVEKRSRAYLRSLVGIAVAARLWSGRSAKHVPYAPTAGFTNVRIPAMVGDELICNVRAAVSTGPVLPMMLVAVTHGDDLRLSLVWRDEVFSDTEIALVEDILTS
jgi:hypothetical protein